MQHRSYALALALSAMGSTASAGIDCNTPVTAVEATICNDAALSEIASLADEIGSAVGLEIRYDDLEQAGDLHQRFDRLLKTLTIADVERLTPKQGRSYLFDVNNSILFLHTEASPLQDMMVVFDQDGTASYIAMEPYDDAGRYYYRAKGNILEIDSSFSPASFTQKFRHQDGCWRLIGQDGAWRDEDPSEQSVNFLTGQEISTFRDGSERVRSFDPFVICLGDGFYSYDIEYHAE